MLFNKSYLTAITILLLLFYALCLCVQNKEYNANIHEAAVVSQFILQKYYN